MSWKPATSFENLQRRAKLLADIREFFAKRKVLEVETPLLGQHTVTDRYIDSFLTQYNTDSASQKYFLQTSPEYAMKRLLAANSGPIYQICKAFRIDESGRQHNPEFTLLEWYRPGFTHHDLMDEIDGFLQSVAKMPAASRLSYRDVFQRELGIDPHCCDAETLLTLAKKRDLPFPADVRDKDTLLQLWMTHVIEPTLGREAPTFLYDFPVSQAALAKINNGVAERFEVYIQGVELANGFHELTNAKEQRQRFERDRQAREQLNKFMPDIDERFIASLDYLPDCAGVALGIDRLLMIVSESQHINDILCFPWEMA